MSTDINAYTDTPALRATAVRQQMGSGQVGSDRHFLTAVLAAAERSAPPCDAAASDAEQRADTPTLADGGGDARYAEGGQHPASHDATRPPPPAHSGNASGRGEPVPAATTTRAFAVTTEVIRPADAMHVQHAPGATGSTPTPLPRAGNRPWLPQNITLCETGEGVEVITRNFFLDDAGRRQLAHRLLQELRQAGKSPRQLTLNGEVVWRAADTEPHELAAGTR